MFWSWTRHRYTINPKQVDMDRCIISNPLEKDIQFRNTQSESPIRCGKIYWKYLVLAVSLIFVWFVGSVHEKNGTVDKCKKSWLQPVARKGQEKENNCRSCQYDKGVQKETYTQEKRNREWKKKKSWCWWNEGKTDKDNSTFNWEVMRG